MGVVQTGVLPALGCVFQYVIILASPVPPQEAVPGNAPSTVLVPWDQPGVGDYPTCAAAVNVWPAPVMVPVQELAQ